MMYPKTLGHGYTFRNAWPFTVLKSPFAQLHRRLTVFHHKGTECANPECDRVGTQLIIGVDKKGSPHVDVYTDDFVLMTVDHIHPKSQGGGEELANKQPMCTDCNQKKGDKVYDADGVVISGSSYSQQEPQPGSKKSRAKKKKRILSELEAKGLHAKARVTYEPFFSCPRCEINTISNPERMCQCPRGGCEAGETGRVKRVVAVELKPEYRCRQT